MVEQERESRVVGGAGELRDHDGRKRLPERGETRAKPDSETGHYGDPDLRFPGDRDGIDDLYQDDRGKDRGDDTGDEAENHDQAKDYDCQGDPADHGHDSGFEPMMEPVDQDAH